MSQISRTLPIILFLVVVAALTWLAFQSDPVPPDPDADQARNASTESDPVTQDGSGDDGTPVSAGNDQPGDPRAPDPDPELAAEEPAREPLRIRLEEGAELAFRVLRSNRRAGRFEGGDTTEIDYAVKVEKVGTDGAIEFEVEFDRIRFQREGRMAMEFDSERRSDGEAALVASLRDLVDRPMRVTVDAGGKVVQVADFPEPVLPLGRLLQKSPVVRGAEDEASRELAGSRREAQLRRMFSNMLRFIVSPEILRADLQTIFASGLQGVELARGNVYRLDRPKHAESRRGRRIQHPGPAPIYSREDRQLEAGATQEPRTTPLQGEGNTKGRGDYVLEFTGSGPGVDGENYEFELVQSYAVQEAVAAPDAPRVGTAAYRKSDGLVENLVYRYGMDTQSARDSYTLAMTIDITRK